MKTCLTQQHTTGSSTNSATDITMIIEISGDGCSSCQAPRPTITGLGPSSNKECTFKKQEKT